MQYPGLRFAVAILTFVTGLSSAAFIGNVRLMPELRMNRARCAERGRMHRRLPPPPPPAALPAAPVSSYEATHPPTLLPSSPPLPPRVEQRPRARVYQPVLPAPVAPQRETR